MTSNLEERRFYGMADRIAEEELGACFFEDVNNTVKSKLFQEYQSDGTVKDPRSWLRKRLESVFVSAGPPPSWVESSPMWPFLNGAPMIFVGQIAVEKNEVSESRLAVDSVLYVFGSRVDCEGGWKMEYRVVEQFRDSPF